MSAPLSRNGHREPGEVLAELPRYGGSALRVTLEMFEGHPFIGVRVWEHGKPTQKGLSVKVKELDAVIAALQAAKAKIGGDR